jgi:hypothetical protein
MQVQLARRKSRTPGPCPASGLSGALAGTSRQHTTGRRSRVFPRVNIMCCVGATWVSLGALSGLPGSLLAAEELGRPTSENFRAAQAPASPEPPAPGDAMLAYAKVESWVHAWSVPEGTEGLPAAAGAAVTLRLSGSIIGRGSAFSARQEGEPDVIRAAAALALEEATARMPVEHDALFQDSLRAMAPSLTISLELAGPLVPLAVREYADVSLTVSAGTEGVAARIGERVDGLFAGTMLANSTEPGSALSAVVSRLTGDPRLGLTKPAELAEEHGAVFYRFRTVHLAQTMPGMTPLFLHRGGRLVDRRELTSAALREWADGMAEHLMQRMWPGEEKYGASGTYHPVTGVTEPPFAGPAEQALLALALVRYSEAMTPSPERAEAARSAAERLMRELAIVEAGEVDPLSQPAAVAAASVVVRALLASGRDHEELRAFSDRLDSEMRRWEDDLSLVPPEQRSIAAWALAQRAAENRLRSPAVERAVRTLYRETPPGLLVTHMPWLGWAELTLAQAVDQPEVDSDIPAAVALREMREQVWKHQLTEDILDLERLDLAGGIVFTASRNPLPTWHSARPIAFMATMLGDDRLTGSEEFARELNQVLNSLRFLRQLSAGEAEGHMYRSPRRAMWGVRASVWDQRMSPEATALTLLAVCELVRGLGSVNNR